MVRGFRGLRFERVAAMSPPYPVSGVLKRAALWLYRRRRQAPPGRITGNNPFLARNPGVSPPSSFSTFTPFLSVSKRARVCMCVGSTFFRSTLSLSLLFRRFASSASYYVSSSSLAPPPPPSLPPPPPAL